MNKLTKLMLILAQLGLVGAAQAASISLSPTTTSASVGQVVTFSVNVNFTDVSTDGGGFLINYDPGFLGSAQFTYSLGLPGSITGTWAPISQTGSLQVGFDADLGFAGATTLGTVSFTSLAAGSGSVILSDPAPAWRFLDSAQWNPIDVSYSGAAITASVNEVPVPAAVWLMASGLSALGMGLRRGRT